MATQSYVYSRDNAVGDTSLKLTPLPTGAKALGTDSEGNIVPADVMPSVAGGDLYGTYPDPRIKELTGVPAMLAFPKGLFNWNEPSTSGWSAGAGIGHGYGYIGDQDSLTNVVTQGGSVNKHVFGTVADNLITQLGGCVWDYNTVNASTLELVVKFDDSMPALQHYSNLSGFIALGHYSGSHDVFDIVTVSAKDNYSTTKFQENSFIRIVLEVSFTNKVYSYKVVSINGLFKSAEMNAANSTQGGYNYYVNTFNVTFNKTLSTDVTPNELRFKFGNAIVSSNGYLSNVSDSQCYEFAGSNPAPVDYSSNATVYEKIKVSSTKTPTHVKCWMACDQSGALYVSYDNWTSYIQCALEDSGLNRYAGVYYVKLPGTSSYYWLFTGDNGIVTLEDIPGNYLTSGEPKLSKMQYIKILGWKIADYHAIAVNDLAIVAGGNTNQVDYFDADSSQQTGDSLVLVAKNVASDSSTLLTLNGPMGGIGCNNDTFLLIERDTGALFKSTNGKTFSRANILSVKYQTGVELGRNPSSLAEIYPLGNSGATLSYITNNVIPYANNGNLFCSILYANDIWIIANYAHYSPTAGNYNRWSPFIYSYDLQNWEAYQPTEEELEKSPAYQASFYKMAYGDGRIFGTNPNPNQATSKEPALFQILVNQIAAHRRLSMEDGCTIAGSTYLTDLPNAILGTDIDGKVVDLTSHLNLNNAPVTIANATYDGEYCSNLTIANAVSKVNPLDNYGSTNHEAVTMLIPEQNITVFLNSSYMATLTPQPSGESLRYTIRDQNLTLLASTESVAVVSGENKAKINNILNGSTLTLLAGRIYYVGVISNKFDSSTNMIGVIQSTDSLLQSLGIALVAVSSFSTIPLQLSDATPTKQLPFVHIISSP